METINKKDGFQPTEADEKIIAAPGTEFAGHLLIDRQGIVRWAEVEAADRIGDLAKFPGDDEILAAADGLQQGLPNVHRSELLQEHLLSAGPPRPGIGRNAGRCRAARCLLARA